MEALTSGTPIPAESENGDLVTAPTPSSVLAISSSELVTAPTPSSVLAASEVARDLISQLQALISESRSSVLEGSGNFITACQSSVLESSGDFITSPTPSSVLVNPGDLVTAEGYVIVPTEEVEIRIFATPISIEDYFTAWVGPRPYALIPDQPSVATTEEVEVKMFSAPIFIEDHFVPAGDADHLIEEAEVHCTDTPTEEAEGICQEHSADYPTEEAEGILEHH